VRSAVGEGPVVDAGVLEDAVLAGEGSGGVAVLPASVTFDAALTVAAILEALLVTERSLAEAAAALPRLFMRKGALKIPSNEIYRVLSEFRSAYASSLPDLTDGVHAVWSDAWLHVRASNTEPLLRIIVEAESEARAEALFREANELAARALALGGSKQS
jgi:phosphomannomutase